MAKGIINVETYLTWDNDIDEMPEDISHRKNTGMRPVYKTKGAACADLAIPRDISINPHEAIKVDLNLVLVIPEGYKGVIYPRSSLLFKYSIMQPVSIIDSDYRGHIHAPLYNMSDVIIDLKAGTRVAQIEIVKTGPKPDEWETEHNIRGSEGFGTTGEI